MCVQLPTMDNSIIIIFSQSYGDFQYDLLSKHARANDDHVHLRIPVHISDKPQKQATVMICLCNVL